MVLVLGPLRLDWNVRQTSLTAISPAATRMSPSVEVHVDNGIYFEAVDLHRVLAEPRVSGTNPP